MTHDELLANINSNNFMEGRTLQTPYFALRAVVELHKPREYKVTGTFTDGLMQTGCACGGWSYPCPTIQVIEAELG